MSITTALLIFLLLGFMGLALDFGHLFVIRTELQTASDACALAGAQELNGLSDALTRATNAGIAAANANNVDLQSTTWSSKPKMSAGDISFRDKDQNPTTVAANARYMVCSHTHAGTTTPLLHMISFVPGSSGWTSTMNVGAYAEATTSPAQSTCPVPLALKPKLGGAKPDWGFVKGEWVTLLSTSTATNGQIGWANLDGSNSASETEAELNGHCGTRVGDTLGTPGVQQSIADIWNSRFGIYKNNDDAATDRPDFTGYVYTKPVAGSGGGNGNGGGGGTAGTWSAGSNAYDDFVARRLAFSPCAASESACESATGLKLNAKALATSAEMRTYGTNRRLVAVPVIDASNKVVDFVCMLLLQPISTPMIDVQLEYRGNASDPGSPCTTNGLPGGTAGPLVPVLVR